MKGDKELLQFMRLAMEEAVVKNKISQAFLTFDPIDGVQIKVCLLIIPEGQQYDILRMMYDERNVPAASPQRKPR